MNDEVRVKIIEQIPGAEEYNFLRSRVGWREYDLESIAEGLRSTLYCICAYHGDDIIGMGRVIGDGKLVFYIQDIIVLPDYQGKHLGTQIMDRIMWYINENSVNNSVIGLMSAHGKEEFYERFGFKKRPDESFGCGMTIFVKK